MKSYEAIRERLPEADFLLPEHTEAVSRYLKDTSLANVEEFIGDNLVRHELGEQPFWLLVDTPRDPSDQIVFVPTGLGADFNPHSVVQADIIRNTFDPNATLVVQANSSQRGNGNNFSTAEGRLLREGDLQPMRDRINVGLSDVAKNLPDAKVAYSGASLGAATTGSVLSHASEMSLDTNGATLIEPANIKNRNLTQLGFDYARSMGDMEEVFKGNFPEGWLDGADFELAVQQKIGLLRRFMTRTAAVGVAMGEAYNLARAMGHDQLSEDLAASPGSIGIVHMWSEQSKISPSEFNRAIAERMAENGHNKYTAFEFKYPSSQHGPTVEFGLHGAALIKAVQETNKEK